MAKIEQSIPKSNEHLKALFDIRDVKGKTELSDIQIESINKSHTLSVLFNIPSMRFLTEDLMELLVSRHRKSRKEYTEGMKSASETLAEKQSFMGAMFGK